ncbi:MAG TPA: D-aminoacylase [Candidatus Atribacteria bacterium]|nr:D-aminoacylase [Candidatus Atribacteria bacterium]
MYDLVLKNGQIYEGNLKEPYIGDIGIKKDKIIKIGNIRSFQAKRIIYARNKIVCPGFIDVHAHDDIQILQDRALEPKLRQGVTTVVNGNCGISFYPLTEDKKDLLFDYVSTLFYLEGMKINWNNYKEYCNEIEKHGVGLNVANLIGHGSLRIAVMGFEQRESTSFEINKMKGLLLQAIEEGIFGLSSGLLYPPGAYAKKDELISLCKVIAQNNLIYSTHIRNESDKICDCIQDNIDLAREIGVSINISHLKISGKNNWGNSKKIINLIQKERKNGLKITADQYPYEAGNTLLTALLPQWALSNGLNDLINKLKINSDVKEKIKYDIKNGIEYWDNLINAVGWENIVINSVNTQQNEDLVGRSLKEISSGWKMDYFDTLFKILIEEEGKVSILAFQSCQEDIKTIFKSRFVMIGTDGIFLRGKPHPRLYGTYPKVIKSFVKEKGYISLKEAIRKMTFLPSKVFGLQNRGQIREGNYADLIVIDFDNIKDLATYDSPMQYPIGIDTVIINGQVVLNANKLENNNAGKVLKPKNKL